MKLSVVRQCSIIGIAIGLVCFSASHVNGATVPASILPNGPRLKIELVGTMPASGAGSALTNAVSPVVVDNDLLLVDQRGHIHRWDGASTSTLYSPSDALPPGISLASPRILNIAPNNAGDQLFVIFSSSTVPSGVPLADSPRSNSRDYQILYRYDLNGATISNPTAITAFDAYLRGHMGGGLVTLNDGSLLFALGDNGDSGEDGLAHTQDDTTHLGKIVRISATDGSWRIVAKGLRNPQFMTLADRGGETFVELVDIGGNVAEEYNAVPLDDLLDDSIIENFGWGRNATDNLAREGTFYIDSSGVVTGMAPLDEASFLQPVGQWGRESASFVAGSGPVTSEVSFETIEALFGDLVSGDLLAVLEDPTERSQDVYRVGLVDGEGQATTLIDLAGGRPDPRFFLFPDGSAGVLLERTGDFYRLTEVMVAVPEPHAATFGLIALLSLIAAMSVNRLRSQYIASENCLVT